jgi:hypothetical protein
MAERRARLQTLVAAQSEDHGQRSAPSVLSSICVVAGQEMHASGAGVTMRTGAGWRGVAATSPLMERVEELQILCGEGPCIEALQVGHPILVEDLQDSVWGNWTGYAPSAQAAGVRAVFAFPIQIGAARLGALDVYRPDPGPLTTGELADGLIFADFALNALLDGQQSAPAGQTAPDLEDAFDYRIYQAQGMLGVQLTISLAEAMTRLRAYALVNELRLGDVAEEILSGTLQLDGDGS